MNPGVAQMNVMMLLTAAPFAVAALGLWVWGAWPRKWKK